MVQKVAMRDLEDLQRGMRTLTEGQIDGITQECGSE